MLKKNTPRHEQISDWLREEIDSGTFENGERIPSESDLSSRFDVSRVTVRHALKTLENEGAIYRRQGLGSFVSSTEIEHPLVCLTDFEEDMKRAGLNARSRVIFKDIVEVPREVAGRLNLDYHSKVIRLDRLRLANGRAIAVDKTWLPLFYGQLLEGHDLEQETIYRVLEKHYEIPILKGHYTISAVSADSYLSENLEIEKGHALLLIDRLSMSIAGKKIYYQQRFYCPDCIKYQVQLERRDEESEFQNRGVLKEFTPVFLKDE